MKKVGGLLRKKIKETGESNPGLLLCINRFLPNLSLYSSIMAIVAGISCLVLTLVGPTTRSKQEMMSLPSI